VFLGAEIGGGADDAVDAKRARRREADVQVHDVDGELLFVIVPIRDLERRHDDVHDRAFVRAHRRF
jgi:hypothetical protein